MDYPVTQISIDLALILRVSLAFSWGVGWATFIQFNRLGQFLAERRTWTTVVAGIGVDMLIAYPGDWWTVALVIVSSSVGIIFRSLWNEANSDKPNPSSYKLLHHLEDIAALSDAVIERLNRLLRANLTGPQAAEVSETLTTAHQIHDHVIDARRGR